MGSFTISNPLLQVWRDQICSTGPGPGAKTAGDVGSPHCSTERGTMAAQVSALRFHALQPLAWCWPWMALRASWQQAHRARLLPCSLLPAAPTHLGTVQTSSDTVGHSWALPTMTSPGLADMSSISHSPGLRGWA